MGFLKALFWAPCCFHCMCCLWGPYLGSMISPSIVFLMIFRFISLSDSKPSLQPLLNCLSDLKICMTLNFPNLNENKNKTTRIFDRSLKSDKQVSAMVKSRFFHLCVIAKVKLYLPSKVLEKAIYASIIFLFRQLQYAVCWFKSIFSQRILLHNVCN